MRLRTITVLATALLTIGGCAQSGGAASEDTGSAPLSLTIWVDDKRAPAVKEAADRFAAESGITVVTASCVCTCGSATWASRPG